MTLLYRIKKGDTGLQARQDMHSLAQSLIDAGADVLIAACTEIPLVLDQESLSPKALGQSTPDRDTAIQLAQDTPLVISTDVLVKRAIAYASHQQPLPKTKVIKL